MTLDRLLSTFTQLNKSLETLEVSSLYGDYKIVCYSFHGNPLFSATSAKDFAKQFSEVFSMFYSEAKSLELQFIGRCWRYTCGPSSGFRVAIEPCSYE